jgi:hypothetical protein
MNFRSPAKKCTSIYSSEALPPPASGLDPSGAVEPVISERMSEESSEFVNT